MNTNSNSNSNNKSKRRVIIVTHYLPFKCTFTSTLDDLMLSNTSTTTSTHTNNVNVNNMNNLNNMNVNECSEEIAADIDNNSQQSSVHKNGQLNCNQLRSDTSYIHLSNTTTTATDTDTDPSDSNNNPSDNNKREWIFTQRRDHSALYAGIQSLHSTHDCIIHIGLLDRVYSPLGTPYPITTHHLLSPSQKEQLSSLLYEEHGCIPVFVDHEVSYGHYEGYCKSILWPLIHYLIWPHPPTNGLKEKQFWADYQRVNRVFAGAVLGVYEQGDLVWVHDYHLLLVPGMVRSQLLLNNNNNNTNSNSNSNTTNTNSQQSNGSGVNIGMFLHTPFPSSELFRCLPQRKEVLEGILGANLVGFQTYAYARHFISSCTRVLGVESTPKGVEYQGNLVNIATFPIGIDVEQVAHSRTSSAVMQKITAIRDLYAGKKIIIGRDKLDEIKGVLHKLTAFEVFLRMFPRWIDKVVLIQVTSPTEATSFKLETKVSEMVSKINGQYGSLGFSPVHHYHHHIDREEYYALLSVANVALITAVRDGMNTTSHEYVVCQQHDECNPLILSEFTGTAGSLSAALQVNPWDSVGVATAINEALLMSREEKEMRHAQLYDYVTMNTARFWAESFIKEMMAVSVAKNDVSSTTPLLDLQLVTKHFLRARKRTFFLDYDGTLTQIRKVPQDAVPSQKILDALSILSRDPQTHIYVVSGRDQTTLDAWLGSIENIGLSAEHGCFVRDISTGHWLNMLQDLDMGWKNDVLPIFEYYTERTPGSFVEHKRSSLTWHYRLADPVYGSWQAKECHNHLENAILSKLPVEVLVGKKNLEVRPQAINKGEIVNRLLADTIGSTKSNKGVHSTDNEKGEEGTDFIFCAGDDKTDEDMFKALKKAGLCTQSGEDTDSPNNGNGENNGNVSCFTCTIGSDKKKTNAMWHVSRTEDMIDVISALADALQQQQQQQQQNENNENNEKK